jgi:hypothetical protein
MIVRIFLPAPNGGGFITLKYDPMSTTIGALKEQTLTKMQAKRVAQSSDPQTFEVRVFNCTKPRTTLLHTSLTTLPWPVDQVGQQRRARLAKTPHRTPRLNAFLCQGPSFTMFLDNTLVQPPDFPSPCNYVRPGERSVSYRTA